MNDRKPRIGPMMRAAAEYVSAIPGCSKRGATLAVGAYYNHYHGFDGPVDRAIRAGLIIADISPNRYRLFVNDRARRLWYARRELLASRYPGRIAELQAEIESLRAGPDVDMTERSTTPMAVPLGNATHPSARRALHSGRDFTPSHLSAALTLP